MGDITVRVQAKDFSAKGGVAYAGLMSQEKFTGPPPFLIKGESKGWWVEWKVTLPKAGKYRFGARLAQFQPIPCTMTLNGVRQEGYVLQGKTSGVVDASSRWFSYGPFDFKEGENVIRIGGHNTDVSPFLWEFNFDFAQEATVPVTTGGTTTAETQQKPDSADPTKAGPGGGTDVETPKKHGLPAFPWRLIPNSGAVIAVTQLQDGTLIGIGTNNELHTRATPTSPWVNVPSSGAVMAVTQLKDGTLVGVGMDHELYTRATLTSPWVHVSCSGSVTAVTQLQDGTIVGIGMDHHLFTRTALTGSWTQVPNSGAVKAVTQLQDGTIVGIGLGDNQVWTRATLTSPWVSIPASGNVIGAVQLSDGSLLGVGADHQLYIAEQAKKEEPKKEEPKKEEPKKEEPKKEEPKKEELSGIVNAHAGVTAIAGDMITLGDATHPFRPGDRVLVIQMAGASIDTADTEGFGTIIDMGGAGHYVWADVVAVDGQNVEVSRADLGGFDAKNGKVQIVKAYSQRGDVTVAGPIEAAAWNGIAGGVIAIESAGTIELGGDIDASIRGFAGGEVSRANDGQGQLGYAYGAAAGAAHKGAGIAAVGPEQVCGRGAAANGGGGGNIHNAGGGGGGNGGAGGRGASEYEHVSGGCKVNGGMGGRKLDFADKAFMGGGGGGGQVNNNQGTAGGNGGGIIILRAQTITGPAGRFVRANGGSAGAAGGDGAGGGGAGGTIILDAPVVSGAFTVEAKGGNGGDCAADHGPGAGGGGGTIRSITPLPSTVTASVIGGDYGRAAGRPRGNTVSEPGIVGLLPSKPICVPAEPSLDWEKDRKEFEAKIADLAAKVADLESRLAKCGQCEVKLAQQKERLDEIEAKLIAHSKQFLGNDELDAAQSKKLATIEEKIAAQDKKIAGADEKIAAQDKKIAGVDELNALQDKKLAIVDEKIVGQNRAIIAMEEKLQAQRKQIDALEEKAAKCAHCEAKLGEQAQAISELRAAAAKCAHCEAKLGEQAQAISELRAAAAKCAHCEAKFGEQAQAIGELRAAATKCAHCEAKQAEQANAIKALHDQNALQTATIDKLTAQVADLARKLEGMKPVPPPDPVKEEPPKKPAKPDNLEIIEGIGPKIAEVLKKEGITTFKQLAASDAGRIKSILSAASVRAPSDPTSWPKQAQLAAEGKLEELQAYQAKLRAGRP